MNMQRKIVTLSLSLLAAGFVTQVQAQYRAVGNDGIAASPKVRQMLSERERSAARPLAGPSVASAGYRAVGNDDIAASPKLRELLNEEKRNQAVSAPSSAGTWVGFHATGKDGITASPKLREQINERNGPALQVAAR